MDNRCDGANVQQVVMRVRNNGQCQAMGYNSSYNVITNAYGKCLDAGDVNNSSNNWLRFSPCHYGNNQRWRQEPINQGGRIWSYQRNSTNQVLCIQYQSLTDQYGLNVVPCTSSQNQKWYGDVGITIEKVPSNAPVIPTVLLNTYGQNYCAAISNPSNSTTIPIILKSCNSSDIEQQWEVIQSNTGAKMYRRKGTTKCIDRYYGSSGENAYMWECDVGAGNHAWNFNSSNRLMYQVQNSGRCWAVLSYSVGTPLKVFDCNAGDARFWMNPISI